MYTVKLSYHYNWPILRQTPQSSGRWGNYQFVIGDDQQEYDAWVVYSDYGLTKTTARCIPENVIFFPAEADSTSPHFGRRFLRQFKHIVTVQRKLKHPGVRHYQNANPWFVKKSYDELKEMSAPMKRRDISIVTSNKAFTDGHVKRLRFANYLKEQFGEKIDLFGRGIRDFADKWDVLAEYKYSVAIENDNCDDWVTEKLVDCLLSFTHPIYYGCPNLGSYLDERCITRINIDDPAGSAEAIRDCIANHTFERTLSLAKEERLKFLDSETLFPVMVKQLSRLRFDRPKTAVTIVPNNTSILDKLTSLRRKLQFRLHAMRKGGAA